MCANMCVTYILIQKPEKMEEIALSAPVPNVSLLDQHSELKKIAEGTESINF